MLVFALLVWMTPLSADTSLSDALASQRFDEALSIADSLLKLQPGDANLWAAKGWALEGLGRGPESLTSFEKALEIEPDLKLALRGAVKVAFRFRDQRLSQFLSRLFAIEPENESAHAIAGILALEARDCDSAVKHFDKSWKVIQDDERVASRFGQCLLNLGRPQQAIPIFEHVVQSNGRNGKARYALAVSQLLVHRPGEAAATLKPAAAKPDAGADVLNLLAAAQYQDRQVEAAVETLRRAARMYPRDERNYVDLATVSLDLKAVEAASQVLDIGINHLPRSAHLYTMRGMLNLRLSKFEQAAADFEQAGRLDPTQVYSTVGLGKLLSQNKQPQQAIALLRGKLKQAPDDWKLNFLLGGELLRMAPPPDQPEFSEARQALIRSIAVRPDFAAAHSLLGKLYLRELNPAKAVEELEIAAKYNPSDQMALNQLLLAYRKLGRKQDSARVAARLREVIRQSHARRNASSGMPSSSPAPKSIQ